MLVDQSDKPAFFMLYAKESFLLTEDRGEGQCLMHGAFKWVKCQRSWAIFIINHTYEWDSHFKTGLVLYSVWVGVWIKTMIKHLFDVLWNNIHMDTYNFVYIFRLSSWHTNIDFYILDIISFALLMATSNFK